MFDFVGDRLSFAITVAPVWLFFIFGFIYYMLKVIEMLPTRSCQRSGTYQKPTLPQKQRQSQLEEQDGT